MWSTSRIHGSAVLHQYSNTAVLHRKDDDIDLHYHCNAFLSLFSVSGLHRFKEHIFHRASLSYYFQI